MDIRELNTPTQRWLCANTACHRGRQRVGLLSIGQYWHVCTMPNDLIWLAKHFLSGTADGSRLAAYCTDVFRCETYGRWGVIQTRRKLTLVMQRYNIQIPGELL